MNRTGTRLAALIVSHPVLDAYAGFVPPLIALLEVRCDLTPWQAASLLSMGSLISGLCQPAFAWLTDRVDSRALGTLGLAVAAAALSSIGFARSFQGLVALFAIGMLGVGAYHPVAAASVGQLAGRRRAAGVTAFFVAGMVGATAGPIVSTRVTAVEPGGFDLLRWAMVPGLVLALVLHVAIRDVPHRHHEHRRLRCSPREARERWATTGLLLAGNAMRYTVHMALLYLYVRWAQRVVAGGTEPGTSIEGAAAIYCGELNALMMLGMGIGGLLAGLLVPAGREKWTMVLVPLLLAPFIAAFPAASRAGTYALSVAGGVGFAAIIPITISVAQRLLPHRTSLASSFMLGGAWAIAAVGPPLAEWLLERVGMTRSFLIVAGLLAASGLLGLPLAGDLIRRAAAGDGPADSLESSA